jgi:hypothetical protein
LKVAGKPPKLHELRDEIQRKRNCQDNVANPSAPGQSLPHRALLALGGLANFDFVLKGQISTDSCSLDIDHMFLSESVEAVIEFFAKSDHPHHMRFSAFSSGFDHEIVMFDEKMLYE